MSTFSECWDTAALGARVTVSNGLPEPSNPDGLPWRLWRSHNFTGALTEKRPGAPRRMVFELDPSNGATVSYEIIEGLGHSFAIET